MTDTLLYSHQYAELDAKLTGRCSKSRKVANNTYLERRPDGDIAVRLHATDVVTFHADGTATLDSGGWLTVTTKARMNEWLPGGISLGSVKGRWYFMYPGHYEGNTYVKSERPAVPYADGVTIDLASLDVIDGQAAAEAVKLEDSANESMRKAVAAYVRKTTPEAIVKAFTHVAGDCMYCNGTFGPERKTDPAHLSEHLEEQYVMYSLTLNAVTERGFVHPDVIMSMIYNTAQRGEVDHFYKDSMRKYLRKHLTVGACATA
jgi:hypothetical protein